jgi:hypothetical protein
LNDNFGKDDTSRAARLNTSTAHRVTFNVKALVEEVEDHRSRRNPAAP